MPARIGPAERPARFAPEMPDDDVEQAGAERRGARRAEVPSGVDTLEPSAEPGQSTRRDPSRMKAGAAEPAYVEHEAHACGYLLQALGRQRRGGVERARRVERVVIVARHEKPDIAGRHLVQPVARARRDPEAEAEGDQALRQRTRKGDPPADPAGTEDDAVALGEGEAAGHGRARHLHRVEPRAVDGVAQILDAANRDALPAAVVRGLRADFALFDAVGLGRINRPHRVVHVAAVLLQSVEIGFERGAALDGRMRHDAPQPTVPVGQALDPGGFVETLTVIDPVLGEHDRLDLDRATGGIELGQPWLRSASACPASKRSRSATSQRSARLSTIGKAPSDVPGGGQGLM